MLQVTRFHSIAINYVHVEEIPQSYLSSQLVKLQQASSKLNFEPVEEFLFAYFRYEDYTKVFWHDRQEFAASVAFSINPPVNFSLNFIKKLSQYVWIRLTDDASFSFSPLPSIRVAIFHSLFSHDEVSLFIVKLMLTMYSYFLFFPRPSMT